MAERRMFAKTIIDSDAFLDMSVTARLLYYDLAMRADDDGFVNSPKKIMRMVGAAEDDLRMLAARKFIIPFDNGVVVIKHWKIHNYIRKDRYNETSYSEQKSMLELDENGAYRICQNPIIAAVNQLTTNGQPNDTEWSTQVRLGKDRLGKDTDNVGKPDYAGIIAYLNEKAGTHYQPTTGKTQTCIRARFNEGFTEDDFKTVIDNMVRDWKGTEWEQYLRPETLFGTKFEGYLNRKPAAKKKGNFTDFKQNDIDFDELSKNIFAN